MTMKSDGAHQPSADNSPSNSNHNVHQGTLLATHDFAGAPSGDQTYENPPQKTHIESSVSQIWLCGFLLLFSADCAGYSYQDLLRTYADASLGNVFPSRSLCFCYRGLLRGDSKFDSAVPGLPLLSVIRSYRIFLS